MRSPYDGREVARVGRAGAEHLRRRSTPRPEHGAHGRPVAAPEGRDPGASREPRLRAATRGVGRGDRRGGRKAPDARPRSRRSAAAETLGDAARVARAPHAELLDLERLPLRGEAAWGCSGASRWGSSWGSRRSTSPSTWWRTSLRRRSRPGARSCSSRPPRPPRRRCCWRRSCTVPGCPPAGSTWCRARGAEAGALLDDPRVSAPQLHGLGPGRLGAEAAPVGPQVSLELGGNAAVIVEPDAGDLGAVAKRIAAGAYSYAGQSCISVQRVLVHEAIAERARRGARRRDCRLPDRGPGVGGGRCAGR